MERRTPFPPRRMPGRGFRRAAAAVECSAGSRMTRDGDEMEECAAGDQVMECADAMERVPVWVLAAARCSGPFFLFR